ncbi:MAG: hypothetical protein AB1465_01105 [Patescibacteria group bacterium]
MDYLSIIKRAWQITWYNKFLWLFGFFAAGVSGISFNFSLPSNGSENLSKTQISLFYQQVVDFFVKYWFVFVFLGIVFFFIFLIFFVLNIVSHGALIGCVNKIEKDQKTGLKDGFNFGFSKFWKMLGLRILVALIIFFTLVILGVPTISLFVFKMYGRGIILLLFALIIFLPLVFVFSLILNYALRYLVLMNLRVFESINSGFNLLKKNILPTIVIFLILVGASLIFGLVILMMAIFVALPSILLGIIAYFIGKIVAVLIVGALAILLFVLLSAIFSSIFNTFVSSVWTLTYLELKTKTGP